MHELNAHSIGISWQAPTATVEGSSISRFVIQLAGHGIHFEDGVQQVITWQEARGYYQQYVKRKTAQLEQLAGGGGGALMAGDNESILFLKQQVGWEGVGWGWGGGGGGGGVVAAVPLATLLPPSRTSSRTSFPSRRAKSDRRCC